MIKLIDLDRFLDFALLDKDFWKSNKLLLGISRDGWEDEREAVVHTSFYYVRYPEEIHDARQELTERIEEVANEHSEEAKTYDFFAEDDTEKEVPPPETELREIEQAIYMTLVRYGMSELRQIDPDTLDRKVMQLSEKFTSSLVQSACKATAFILVLKGNSQDEADAKTIEIYNQLFNKVSIGERE